MKQFGILSAAVLCAGLIAGPVSAETVCLKNSVAVKNGVVRFAKSFTEIFGSCSSGYSALVSSSTLSGFVSFDQNGKLQNFGGKNVSSVSVAHTSTGNYTLTFKGKFPLLSATNTTANQNSVVLQATARESGYETIDASVTSATSTEIQITVSTWSSTVLSTTDALGGFVSFMIGESFA